MITKVEDFEKAISYCQTFQRLSHARDKPQVALLGIEVEADA